MISRRQLPALAFVLAGCGLSERPFEERRQWPLAVPRPTALPARRGGLVLELRGLREGPGMSARGLQTLQADGSLKVGFYEEWLVPPAQAVEDALRQWLIASGRFAAVVAPGSRADADLILEGELTTLMSVPAAGVARAALGIVVIDARAPGRRTLAQRSLTAEARLTNASPAAAVAAQAAALAEIFGGVEQALSAG